MFIKKPLTAGTAYCVRLNMKIVVTGFRPFLGATTNPSEDLARELAKLFPEVHSHVLPVEFGHSFELLRLYLQHDKPDYIIMLGQAAGRTRVCFEKIALNWVQSEHPDEAGRHLAAGAILDAHPLALMTKFPVDKIVSAIKEENLLAEVSFSAGAFVCNDLYFRVLAEYGDLKAVFVHLPLVKDLEFEIQLKILKKALSELLLAQSDKTPE